MRRIRQQDTAFTLVELMVVMGIMAAVLGITIPVARSLTQGNKAMNCASKMQRIGQALRMYALDEGSVPPFYPEPDTNGNLQEPLPPDSDAAGWAAEVAQRRGLLRLVDAGYLKGDDILHCPADRAHGKDTPQYAYSYMTRDPMAATSNTTVYQSFNQYKYLTCRGLRSDSADEDVRRQLSPLPVAGSVPNDLIPGISRSWHPDDATVVMWCDYHYEFIKEGKKGQYNVLFWDGSVRRMPGDLFRSGNPEDAFRVLPEDDPTP